MKILFAAIVAVCVITPRLAEAFADRTLDRTVQVAPADTSSAIRFDIFAAPLAVAIEQFSRQSGLSITIDTVLASGLRSTRVVGRYTPPEALRRLLRGTGVVGEFANARTVVLRRAQPRELAMSKLSAVRVEAEPGRSSGYGAPESFTATKTATRLRDVPQSVTVITRALMRDQAMQSMADVVRYVPGATMGQGEGNRDQPTIRGNSSTADFFVDGVRDDVQYFRDLYNVERVEALMGSNAMIFGRGGGGGVLNRVTKEAQPFRLREVTLQGGSYNNKRLSADFGQRVAPATAARLNAVYEASGRYRDGVTLRRYGFNPTMTIAPAHATRLTLGYEYFVDHRTADRGIPSFKGRPVRTHASTFFGDPDLSYSDARVSSATAAATHDAASGLRLSTRMRFASYDKFYQNVFPGSVDPAGLNVSISAYNLATRRQNLFNQTDLTYAASTGRVRHTLLVGAEAGRQTTDNLRKTGYFGAVNNSATLSVPISDPTVSVSTDFRQSATDADNHVTNTVGSVYAQDQIALSSHWQAIAGVRYERFDLRYHNNRSAPTLRRVDGMVSPRVGLLFKPVDQASLYASHSVSYLPSAGDQFSALTDVTKALEPERFANYELGAKWDVDDRLAVTTAFYRLDRTNTRAPHPVDPARTLQTGGQRTTGYELAVNGNISALWEVAAGYSAQSAVITSTTAAARRGASVPLVPRSTLTLWNRYQLTSQWGVGLGVVRRAAMYAAIDNLVTVPGMTEACGAVYGVLGKNIRAQVNVENLFDATYYVTAHSNNNITPGSPRANFEC